MSDHSPVSVAEAAKQWKLHTCNHIAIKLVDSQGEVIKIISQPLYAYPSASYAIEVPGESTTRMKLDGSTGSYRVEGQQLTLG